MNSLNMKVHFLMHFVSLYKKKEQNFGSCKLHVQHCYVPYDFTWITPEPEPPHLLKIMKATRPTTTAARMEQ